MEPQFRLAAATDIDTLVDFMRRFYALDGYPFEEHSARVALENMVHDLALGRVWLILRAPQEGEEPIGYIVITFGYSLEFHGRDAFIDELFIEEAWRGQGVGSAAMRFALAACKVLGIHALHLEVERANVAGQRLYRKFGFKDQDRHLMTRRVIE